MEFLRYKFVFNLLAGLAKRMLDTPGKQLDLQAGCQQLYC